MIQVYVSEILYDENEPLFCKKEEGYPLPHIVFQKIENTKNIRLAKERACAYRLLMKALSDNNISNDDVKNSFRFTEKGKPYLEGSFGVSFSLSHAEGLAAVIVSDCAASGIDIEKIDKSKSDLVRRSNERFFSKKLMNSGINEKITLIAPFEIEIEEYPDITEEKVAANKILEYDDFVLWTTSEAILKCDGGGFYSLKKLGSETENTRIKTFICSFKNDIFSLTVAIE